MSSPDPPQSATRTALAGLIGNTLEWFTPSPPPPHNFDVIPVVRSVEPMKDIRRQVAAQTGRTETVAQPLAPRSL